jgi:hypothetical protein
MHDRQTSAATGKTTREMCTDLKCEPHTGEEQKLEVQWDWAELAPSCHFMNEDIEVQRI